MRGHRAVVSAASSSLEAAIQEQLQRGPAAAAAAGDLRLVMGVDVQAADFRLLLRYMYTGTFAPSSAAEPCDVLQICAGAGGRRRVGALAHALGLKQLAAALQVRLPIQ